MKKVKFNFGLNNSPFSETETIKIYLTTLKSAGILVQDSYIAIGEHNGEPEKTLVVSASYDIAGGKRRLTKIIQSLCIICDQKYIKIDTETGGGLVCSPLCK